MQRAIQFVHTMSIKLMEAMFWGQAGGKRIDDGLSGDNKERQKSNGNLNISCKVWIYFMRIGIRILKRRMTMIGMSFTILMGIC